MKGVKGSGGIGILISDVLLKNFNVKVIDDTTEGILWTQLTCKCTSESVNVCCVYLPPENSVRKVNAEDFFDNLLSQVYMYQNQGDFIICGDFNSRIGEMVDFNVGIDDVPDRNNIDNQTNHYGELLIDFLVASNCCVVNGRVGNDNFTSVSTKGAAVVDYIIVSHEMIKQCKQFDVMLAKDVFTACSCIGVYNCTIPDHSLLSLSLDIKFSKNISKPNNNSQWNHTYTKVSRNIPNDFMLDMNDKVESCIQRLEKEDNIESVYSEFSNIVTEQMSKKLNNKVVNVDNVKITCKHRHKPWFNDKVKEKWIKLKESEKSWLLYKKQGVAKSKHKSTVRAAQKEFDRCVQQSKRKFWHEEQARILSMYDCDKNAMWKTIGKIGINKERKKQLPFEAVNRNGICVDDREEVLEIWKESFEKLLNSPGTIEVDKVNTTVSDDQIDISMLDGEISNYEIINVMRNAKKGKACGVDDIPLEALCNDTCLIFLRKLFNICLETGVVPEMWQKGIINPIPKGSMANDKDPNLYRGITLAVASYKLFCGVLNSRLQRWVEVNGLLMDEQNGFRKNRSCTDHLHSLSSIIETRMKLNLSTYTAFIDFRKAYDSIKHNLLWEKLKQYGLNEQSNVFMVLRNIYSNIKCCVRVNGFKSDWFSVTTGLRQGCILSPILFNLYINDLVSMINTECKGVDIAGENVCMLMYADDLVLLAKTENDLQDMLSKLSEWCNNWSIEINTSKSQIVHFRRSNKSQTARIFTIGDKIIDKVKEYRYLGLVLNEHLDWNLTAKHVAKSAHRALGALIAKSKAYGGLPFRVFKKLYESLVLPVIHYCSSLWGVKEYSCINAVHNKACRYFLGVRKYTANAAVQGDTGLHPPIVDQWTAIGRHWCRVVNMDVNRLNKKVFMWAYRHATNAKCKNWVWNVVKYFKEKKMDDLVMINGVLNKDYVVNIVNTAALESYVKVWKKELLNDKGRGKNCQNKLRTYRLLKDDFQAENYVNLIMGKQERSAIASFRCGSAPIRLETGRYRGLPVNERVCQFCDHNEVEDECHVLLKCPMYCDLRDEFYEHCSMILPLFKTFPEEMKLQTILASNDVRMIRISAKFCSNVLKRLNAFNSLS